MYVGERVMLLYKHRSSAIRNRRFDTEYHMLTMLDLATQFVSWKKVTSNT